MTFQVVDRPSTTNERAIQALIDASAEGKALRFDSREHRSPYSDTGWRLMMQRRGYLVRIQHEDRYAPPPGIPNGASVRHVLTTIYAVPIKRQRSTRRPNDLT